MYIWLSEFRSKPRSQGTLVSCPSFTLSGFWVFLEWENTRTQLNWQLMLPQVAPPGKTTLRESTEWTLVEGGDVGGRHLYKNNSENWALGDNVCAISSPHSLYLISLSNLSVLLIFQLSLLFFFKYLHSFFATFPPFNLTASLQASVPN